MAFCTNCGEQLLPNSKFCHVCGTPAANHSDEPSTFSDCETIPHFVACPQCHHIQEVGEGYTVDRCPHCGHPLQSGAQATSNAQNQASASAEADTQWPFPEYDLVDEPRRTNEEKRNWTTAIVALAILLLIPFSMHLGAKIEEWIARNEGKISAGDYHDLVGERYDAVEAHFEAAGFTNIELIDLDDAGLTFWKDGKVKSISVGGDTDFDDTDWFDPDTKVVISYH